MSAESRSATGILHGTLDQVLDEAAVTLDGFRFTAGTWTAARPKASLRRAPLGRASLRQALVATARTCRGPVRSGRALPDASKGGAGS